MLTREVRSATVAAKSDVTALRLQRGAFERILERHPQIAAHFANVIAARISETRKNLAAVCRAEATPVERSTVRRAWSENVVSRGLELPIVALIAFTATLLVLRGVALVFSLREMALLTLLRSAYTTGFLLVFGATATALLRYRRRTQRMVAATLGVGIGAIVNGLSVFLAFDIFYLDMTRRDPQLVFSIDTLYHRNEAEWAALLVVVFLLQLTFLRRFYKRLWLILRLRVMK
jgi:hypothetical protein